MKTSRRLNRASGSTRQRVERYAAAYAARIATRKAFLGHYEQEVRRELR